MRKMAVLLILAVGFSAQAGKFKKVVGQTFPELKASCLVSEQTVDLGVELKKGKLQGAAVIFTSYNCPVALAYDQRIGQASETYGEKVPFFFLDANAAETGDKLKDYAAQSGFKGVIAMDEGAKTAKAIGAGVTPEVYLLNAKGEVVFTTVRWMTARIPSTLRRIIWPMPSRP